MITILFAQTNIANGQSQSSSEIQINLQKLNQLGSVLYFAAHPDDENTRLIAWLAQEKKYKTAYLSLTRGDGGQNLLGTDIGIDLGLIRTQELLAARAIDKGEQFFSSAYDFGFSKTHEETFGFWDKETALREAVWIIRKFQPDVIINRFPPDKRGGHGHHQASAMLAHEAFIAAADKTKFPEQLQTLSTWQAKRLIWNTANFGGMNNTSDDQLKIDIGHYNPLLGESYGEIAAQSRSQHKTQGFGAASSRGSSIEYFEHVAGIKAENTLFDGIETSWNRIPNANPIQDLITKINTAYQSLHPEKSVNDLITLKKLLNNYIVDNKKLNAKNVAYWIENKKKEVDDLIIACAGVWIDAFTDQAQFVVNQDFPFKIEAIVRNPTIDVELLDVNSQKQQHQLQTNILWKGQSQILAKETTQPYWLVQPHTLGKFNIPIESVGYPTNPTFPKATFVFRINGEPVEISKEIKHRFVDPVKGEVHDPIVVLPELTVEISNQQVLSKNLEANTVELTFSRHNSHQNQFEINIDESKGWIVSPSVLNLDFGNQNTVSRTVSIKPNNQQSAKAILKIKHKGTALQRINAISYDHVPAITWFPTVEITCQNLQLDNQIKHVGYLAGAGDLVAESLQQIDIQITNLSDKDLNPTSLQSYDAVVVGVRYFNVIKNSAFVFQKLMEYANAGGVVLIQYNVNSKLTVNQPGPYPFSLSRARVTEENSKVLFNSQDPAMSFPNKLTVADFDNWVQERGLYFAENVANQYRTPLSMHDQNESAHSGSLLITKYGKGKFVYTSLSFFRQLPAGVPGAYRLFVNLLTNEK